MTWEVLKQVNKIETAVEKTVAQEVALPGAGGVSTATLPLAITSSNIAIAVTPANPGGAVALQGQLHQAPSPDRQR
jgi:hypothetical protein